MESDVSNAILSLLNGDGMTPSLNSSFIALISKKQDDNFVCDFQPINLCNVIYKITSKSITNRPKPLMNVIISCNKSAFIPSRLILDNIMIAHKLLHSLNKLRKCNNRKMAVKLDMSKTYN